MVVPDQQLAQAKAATQNYLHKVFRRVRRQLRREWKNREIVDSRLGQDFLLFVVSREEQRRRRRIHDLEWMWLEGDEHAGNLERARSIYQTLDHVAVAAVNTVERADGNDRPAHVRREA